MHPPVAGHAAKPPIRPVDWWGAMRPAEAGERPDDGFYRKFADRR
jgi:hypothetical protein